MWLVVTNLHQWLQKRYSTVSSAVDAKYEAIDCVLQKQQHSDSELYDKILLCPKIFSKGKGTFSLVNSVCSQ